MKVSAWGRSVPRHQDLDLPAPSDFGFSGDGQTNKLEPWTGVPHEAGKGIVEFLSEFMSLAVGEGVIHGACEVTTCYAIEILKRMLSICPGL